jgi:hypothetical protein
MIPAKSVQKLCSVLSLSTVFVALGCSGAVQLAGDHDLPAEKKSGTRAAENLPSEAGSRPDQVKSSSGNATNAEDDFQPAGIPVNVAGANLTFACLEDKVTEQQGRSEFTKFACQYNDADGKPIAGYIPVSKIETVFVNGARAMPQFAVAPPSKERDWTLVSVWVANSVLPKLEQIISITGVEGQSVESIFRPKKAPAAEGVSPNGLSPNQLVVGGGEPAGQRLGVDYGRCNFLANAGTIPFSVHAPASCSTGSVVTLIESEERQQMTCCPLKTPAVLTGEVTTRVRECGESEVLIGFENLNSGKLFCAAWDPVRVKSATPTPAQFVRVPLPGELPDLKSAGILAAMKFDFYFLLRKYEGHDAAICPRHSLFQMVKNVSRKEGEARCVVLSQ